MRVQQTAWCVTMATAVSLPKITMHTHKYSNPVAEKKAQHTAICCIFKIHRSQLDEDA